VSTNTPESKKILLLEEEKQKLKREIDDIWETVEAKAAEISKKNIELKKFEEAKALIEDYKTEKTLQSKQIKELQEKLRKANGRILDLEQEMEYDRSTYERMSRLEEPKSPISPVQEQNQKRLTELGDFAKNLLEEMQEKLNFYRDRGDRTEKLEREVNEGKLKLFKLEADFTQRISETKRQLEQDYEDRIAGIYKESKINWDKCEARYKDIVTSLENELKIRKDTAFDKEQSETQINQIKIELQTLRTNNDTLKTVNFNLQRIKEERDKELLKMSCDMADLKMNYEKLQNRLAGKK